MNRRIVAVLLVVGLMLFAGSAYSLTEREILQQKLVIAEAQKEMFLAQQEIDVAQAEVVTAQASVKALTTPELINVNAGVVQAKANYAAAGDALVALVDNSEETIIALEAPLLAAKKQAELDRLAAQSSVEDAFKAIKTAQDKAKTDAAQPISEAQAKVDTARARYNSAKKIIDDINIANKAADIDNQISSITAVLNK